MVTVSAAPRSTTIVLASPSAGPFALTFRLFEEDSVKVYVDGVESVAWTLSATFTDGYDDAATITFGAAVGSGSTIVIDSVMIPAREDDLVNGDRNLVAKLNAELARTTRTPGIPCRLVTSGYVTWSSTSCGERPAQSVNTIT